VPIAAVGVECMAATIGERVRRVQLEAIAAVRRLR
jgi:hypothetical protein